MQAMQGASAQAQSMAESIARDRDQKLTLEGLLSIAQSEPSPVAATPGGSASPAESAAALNAATPAQQLEILRGNRTRAATRFKPQHPDMIKLDKAIADLEQKVKTDPGTPTTVPSTTPAAVTVAEATRRERLTNMRAQIDSLTRQIAFKEAEERRLRATVANYQSRLEATPGVDSEWQALTRDYETLQASYRGLLSKSQDAKVARDMEKDQIGEVFRVIDAARVPVRPIGPFRLQLNGIALGIGLLLGVGMAAFLEFRDSSFASESDIHDVLSLPVLALVPYLPTEPERDRARRQRLAFTAGAVMFFGVSGYVFWAMKLWKHVI
jgi:uncharacterized protein involved in exopolysaccharide biosynthesis